MDAPGSLLSDLCKLLRCMDDADACVCSEDDTVHLEAHRTVLAARSPVMARMLRDSPRVVLSNEYTAILDWFRRYLYTDKLPSELELQDVMLMLKLADYLEVVGLKSAAEKRLLEAIDEENALTMLELSCAYNAPGIFSHSSRYIAANCFQRVVDDPDWLELMKDEPHKANEVIKLAFAGQKRPRLEPPIVGAVTHNRKV